MHLLFMAILFTFGDINLITKRYIEYIRAYYPHRIRRKLLTGVSCYVL